MKRLVCLLCREAMALWADSGNAQPAVFLRHIRRCRACAAYQTRQQALVVQLREAARSHQALPPDPALATRVLALARVGEADGPCARRYGRRLRFAGVVAVAAVAVMVARLVMPPSRSHSGVAPTAPLSEPDPIPAFAWAESVLRGDALQTEWDRLTVETLALATDLAEEVRLTLL